MTLVAIECGRGHGNMLMKPLILSKMIKKHLNGKTMNYEKAYKEALERARRLYEQGTITESLSYVFPELN